MSIEAPQSREEILQAFERQDSANSAFWTSFGAEAFFRPRGEGWSAADTVRHLIKSTFPVVKALGMPRIVLRVLFGRPKREPWSYEQYRERYLAALAAGGKAGRFSPSRRSESDLEAWRSSILSRYATVNRNLRSAIARWPDPRLDAYQLPHPLLGNLSVREMLFSTLYHQRHHIDVIRRKAANLTEQR